MSLNLAHLLIFKLNTFLHVAHLLIKNEANNGLVKSNVLKTVSWNKSCLFVRYAVGANSQRKRKVGNNDDNVPPSSRPNYPVMWMKTERNGLLSWLLPFHNDRNDSFLASCSLDRRNRISVQTPAHQLPWPAAQMSAINDNYPPGVRAETQTDGGLSWGRTHVSSK